MTTTFIIPVCVDGIVTLTLFNRMAVQLNTSRARQASSRQVTTRETSFSCRSNRNLQSYSVRAAQRELLPTPQRRLARIGAVIETTVGHEFPRWLCSRLTVLVVGVTICCRYSQNHQSGTAPVAPQRDQGRIDLRTGVTLRVGWLFPVNSED